ncbi:MULTISPECIES: HEAT repeat domain-containing protein [Streptomyces]|uniref:HEAT repeat domain-containing protein n=1 Tax=Streptomyces griseosporeus TaxID=1910 RepID=A0ABV3KVE7_STRGS|nr:HEAT repeat domain-containing protein [Streptomyces actuosus]MBM4822294.1 HEAT repeat domain-containing protein [Streptomyces actuosus]
MTASGRNSAGVGGSSIASAVGANASLTIGHLHLGATPEPPPDEERIARELARHATRLRSLYGRLDLDVLTGRHELRAPVVELPAVFVPPLLRADPPPVELPRELRKRLEDGDGAIAAEELPPGLDEEWLEQVRQAYRERPPVELLPVLSDPENDRLVLLGDPGAGKSTLAQYLALALVTEPVPEPLARLAGRVPVVVELRGYADKRWRDRSFMDYLEHLHTMEQRSVPRPVLETLLKTGRALVVFDGLDELFDLAVRAETGRRIAAFATRYPAARIVVTSRVIGYQRGDLAKAHFRHYMLQDLTRYQIREFVRQWYDVVCRDDPELSARLRARLTDAVTASRPVRELAGNPLLLTILAILGRRQELPRDRQGVYRHAVDLLVSHWDQETKQLGGDAGTAVLRQLDSEDRGDLLRLLARRMQEGAHGIAGNHIHGRELQAVFVGYLEEFGLPRHEAVSAAREMIRQFRERNFILSRFGDEVYGFVHRAFLEYLAADDIARRYQREREWDEERLVRDIFVRRAGDPAWHEVLLLLVGALSERDAARVVTALLELHGRQVRRGNHHMLVLAVRALAEVRRVGLLAAESRAVVDALIDSLERNLGHTAQEALATMLPALSALAPRWPGRSRFLRWYLLRGQFLTHHALPSKIAAALYSGPGVLLVLAEHSPSPARQEMLRTVINRWPDLPAAWELVWKAVDAPDWRDRRAGLENLARWWAEGDDVRDLFFERAVSDTEPRLRGACLEMLAERWGDREDVRVFVLGRAVDDLDPGCRRQALWLLGHRWPDDAATWPLITARATQDEDAEPRQGALRLLAEQRPRPAGIREMLVERATADRHPEVRREALEALARHGMTDEEVRDLALAQAVDDTAPEPRRGALEVLIWRWPSLDGLRDLLMRRSVEDVDPQPRMEALEGLVWRWHGDDDVRDLVIRRATADDSPDLRWLALQFLARRWSGHDGVRDLLVRQATADPASTTRQEALWLLAEAWEDRGDLRELLLRRAVEDRARGPRDLALQLSARFWPTDDEVRALLLDRATADLEPLVRRNALLRIAWLLDGDPATTELLRAAASADSSPVIRRAAVRVLAFGRPRDAATAALLAERADADDEEEVRSAAAQALAAARALAALPDDA